MLMKSLVRNPVTMSMIARGSLIPRTPFMMTAPIRSFSLPRYHFDDKDFVPTIEEVSQKKLHSFYNLHSVFLALLENSRF